MFSTSCLLKLRKQALRRHLWFKVLDQAERAILNLVPICVDTVKSQKLLRIIENIMAKIHEALKGPLRCFKDHVGRSLARKISLIAQAWGNKSARDWAEDEGFTRYLAIVKMNDSFSNIRF